MQIVAKISEHHRTLVFDSGVGGLSVVGEIRKRLPDLAIDYVADDAFRPYGEKSVAALVARLPALLATLENMTSPDCIIIACNTASTTALEAIRDCVRAPVIGVVPAIKPAAETSRTKTIGVLGTPGTVRRKYVNSLITRFASDCQVALQGSVNLVNLAEKKLSGEHVPLSLIRDEITPLFSGRIGAEIDTVVLACTHFPLLVDELQASVTQSVQWIDSGSAIAKRVETVLDGVTHQKREEREDIAFLIGPQTDKARNKAFNSYGFQRIIGLMPG